MEDARGQGHFKDSVQVFDGTCLKVMVEVVIAGGGIRGSAEEPCGKELLLGASWRPGGGSAMRMCRQDGDT